MCYARGSRLFFQLTAVSASDHLRAFSMCLDSGICMATLLPYASSRLLLMDCVCLCVRARAPLCVLGVLDGGIRDGSSDGICHRLCTYMRAFTPYSIMEDFNGLVFHHTVRIRRLLGPCAGCPAPSGAARDARSRPSHIKHAPPLPRPMLLQWNVVPNHPPIRHPLLYLFSFPKMIRNH
jgi:hypothetical protein